MQREHEYICIVCPVGCQVKVTIGEGGRIMDIAGSDCEKGKKYAQSEYTNPVRVLTGTVLTEGGTRRLLPFRTDKPIPKGKVMEVVRYLAQVKARPPVTVGQAIVSNILDTWADVVATDELPG